MTYASALSDFLHICLMLLLQVLTWCCCLILTDDAAAPGAGCWTWEPGAGDDLGEVPAPATAPGVEKQIAWEKLGVMRISRCGEPESLGLATTWARCLW